MNIPYTIYHTPYTIHHTPYTIHHTPYTIHYTPYTIGRHDAPWNVGGHQMSVIDTESRDSDWQLSIRLMKYNGHGTRAGMIFLARPDFKVIDLYILEDPSLYPICPMPV
jgi:hypothetical protein